MDTRIEREDFMRSIRFAVVLCLWCAASAHAAINFNLADGATISQLPIAISGSYSGAPNAVFLQVQQDPTLAAPPTGIGGATVFPPVTLTNGTWSTNNLYLLNGSYRLTVQSNLDLPVTIDITVNVSTNPGFVDCVTDPGGLGVQTKVIDWNPGVPTGAPSLNVNVSRSSFAGDPELFTAPTLYAVGTPFVCTQGTAGHVPRMLIFGADPVIDVNSGFSGWSYDANSSALTARMQTVSGYLPNATPINSMIAGLFAIYDDDPVTPFFAKLTGSWLASNGGFTFTTNIDANGKIIALKLTVNGPKGQIAFFKAFFPTSVVNSFFGPTCADIPDPTLPNGSLQGNVNKTAVGALGCELSLDAMFQSPITMTIPIVPPPPKVTVPPPITTEATSPNGATVNFTASATGFDGNEPVTCVPASGATFPLGLSVVHCSATDSYGHTGMASFDVTVTDTTPPTLSVPPDFGVTTVSIFGKAVTYSATATDIADPAPTVACQPASGATFPLGVTTVNCIATDASGNSAQASFHVTVTRIQRQPINWHPEVWHVPFVLPTDVSIEATSADGVIIAYDASTDAGGAVSCTPASGSTFPIGRTVVTCTAIDIDGNPFSDTVTITVVDRRSPLLLVPGTRLRDHRWRLGPDPTPIAPGVTDLSSKTAWDDGFTSAPMHANIHDGVGLGGRSACTDGSVGVLSFDGSAESFVDFGAVAQVGAHDFVLSFRVNTSASGGSPLTLLSNRTARSENFLEATIQPTGGMRFEMNDGAGGDVVSDGPIVNDGAWHHIVVIRHGATLTMSVDGTIAATTVGAAAISVANGNALRLGGADGEGRAFQISGPLEFDEQGQLSSADDDACGVTPAQVTLTTTARSGAPLVFGPDPSPFGPDPTPFGPDPSPFGPDPTPFLPFSIDAVDGRPVVICQALGQVVRSGQVFPIGTTPVTCTATDASGNSASADFTVRVVLDRTAPVLTLPGHQVAEATGPGGAVVTFAASAIDDVDGAVPVGCAPGSGALFPIGRTTVGCAASDRAGNARTGSFVVTVRDTTPPAIVSVTPSVRVLPNTDHIVPVSIAAVVTDAADPAPACRITRISGGGTDLDHDGIVDWQVTGALTFNVEAVARKKKDRTYTITVRCTDASGNASREQTTVVVSHVQ